MNGILNRIIDKLPPMLSGDALTDKLSVFPQYDISIMNGDIAKRLMSLNDIYKVYIPSAMSVEIYDKLYLSILRSFEKKESIDFIRQYNENFKIVKGLSGTGIIGGTDSFSIIGRSGIGKSLALSRAIEVSKGNYIIEFDDQVTSIIPCIAVQCPHDCSVKSLLLDILLHIDMTIGSNYHEKSVHARATTDMLIGSVSNAVMNHTAVLIVDEIQNVIKHKAGSQLIGFLTQLINNSGISIVLVGTPEVTVFFEQSDYLARRTIGLKYDACPYDDYFRHFCETLFDYQYTVNRIDISDAIIKWLYEHSNGILAVVVTLIHDAQEIAILRGIERLDLDSLNIAYQERLTMLHCYINPGPIRNPVPQKKKIENERISVAKRKIPEEFTLPTVISSAKKDGRDVVSAIAESIPVMEISL